MDSENSVLDFVLIKILKGEEPFLAQSVLSNLIKHATSFQILDDSQDLGYLRFYGEIVLSLVTRFESKPVNKMVEVFVQTHEQSLYA